MTRDDRRNGTGTLFPAPGRPQSHDQVAADADGRTSEPDSGDAPHHHVALLYEDSADQFAGVVPLLREGLENGERCVYIYDDNAKEDVEAAMREAGIDVDAAVEAGDLSFHAKEGPFLQDGDFEPAETIDFAVEAIREATQEDGYDGVRVAGEMTWMLDGERSLDRMIEYERTLNSVFGPRPVVGICQYNVARFDPEIVNQIIRTHPHLVYGGAVGRDFYYLPPDEVDGVDVPVVDADELAQTFLERVTAYETLQRRERALCALNDATQEVMHLDADEVASRGSEIVREVLDVAFASVWSYDQNTGELELHASSGDSEIGTALTEHCRDHAWEAFVTGHTQVYDDLPPAPDSDAPETPIQSGVVVPLGRHGVFCVGSTRSDAFDETTVKLATTVGVTVEAALDRADRERRLAEKNDQLERLNRINSVIRGIGGALVEADTREEIEQIVCERLAASDPYQFVWIGERDLDAETITPRAWTGERDGYLDTVTVTTDDEPTGRGPITEAVRTRTVQTVQDVLTDPSFAPWRETTLRHGFRACIAVPLVFEDVFYGVLTLYADTPNAFDETEQTVLEELGETIAHAIDAAETRQTLQADNVAELRFVVRETDDVLARLARDVGFEINFDGLVDHSSAPTRVFFTARDVDPADVVESGETIPGISEVEAVRDAGTEYAFKATVTAPTLAARVVDNQAVVRSLTVTADDVTAVVDLPSTTGVREFLDALRTTYPDIELVARQSRDRPIQTGRELRDAVEEGLTRRQREVLETAYLSGFFESPRARTGTELAEALDISQSTLTHHLREAQRKLCEMVFENV